METTTLMNLWQDNAKINEYTEEGKIRVCDYDSVISARKDVNDDIYGDTDEWNGRPCSCCICCGKPVYMDRKFTIIHLLTNGHLTDSNSKDISDTLDQGWFAIGNDCYKKYIANAQVVDKKEYLDSNN